MFLQLLFLQSSTWSPKTEYSIIGKKIIVFDGCLKHISSQHKSSPKAHQRWHYPMPSLPHVKCMSSVRPILSTAFLPQSIPIFKSNHTQPIFMSVAKKEAHGNTQPFHRVSGSLQWLYTQSIPTQRHFHENIISSLFCRYSQSPKKQKSSAVSQKKCTFANAFRKTEQATIYLPYRNTNN